MSVSCRANQRSMPAMLLRTERRAGTPWCYVCWCCLQTLPVLPLRRFCFPIRPADLSTARRRLCRSGRREKGFKSESVTIESCHQNHQTPHKHTLALAHQRSSSSRQRTAIALPPSIDRAATSISNHALALTHALPTLCFPTGRQAGSSMASAGFFEALEARVKAVDSLLCVGLDPHAAQVRYVCV